MANTYRIFGNELSPYSVKVRSYFRYKEIPHRWIVRSRENDLEYNKYARLPLIPLVVADDESVFQDSTPILEHFEAIHPTPRLQPENPALSFLSALLEEYADEWVNKSMFHFRWSQQPDRDVTAARLAMDLNPGACESEIEDAKNAIVARMVPRLALVGSSPENRAVIEASFERQLRLLEGHLQKRPYLFGGRPALADFGYGPEFYELTIDPSPSARLKSNAPRVTDWARRMVNPVVGPDFESWETLRPTLLPLLREEVAGCFFPWSDANARALAEGRNRFKVQLLGGMFAQATQKYHSKSLSMLRRRYHLMSNRLEIDQILEDAGCLGFLREE